MKEKKSVNHINRWSCVLGHSGLFQGPPAVMEQQLTVPCHPQGQPGVDDICDTVSPSLAERNRGQSVKGEGAVA